MPKPGIWHTTMAAQGKRWSLLTLAPVLAMAVAGATCAASNSDVDWHDAFRLLERACNSMLRGLTFFSQMKEYLTVDAMLGVVIVREQSDSMLRILAANTVPFRSSPQHQFIRQKLLELHRRSLEVTMAMPHTVRQDPLYFQGKSFLQTKLQSTKFFSLPPTLKK